MTGQIKNNRPRLRIKEMDKEEKEMYIKFPLIMLVTIISATIVMFFVAVKDRSLNAMYLIGLFSTILLILLITDWWEAFNNLRNGRTLKRSRPEIWKQMQEEKKIREIERKNKG